MTPDQMRQKAAEYHAQAKAYSPQFRSLIKSRFNSQAERDRYTEIGNEMSRLDGLGFELERQADIMESQKLLDSLVAAITPFSTISKANKIHAVKVFADFVRSGKSDGRI
jgi:hypothetical protein